MQKTVYKVISAVRATAVAPVAIAACRGHGSARVRLHAWPCLMGYCVATREASAHQNAPPAPLDWDQSPAACTDACASRDPPGISASRDLHMLGLRAAAVYACV
jgi:hypothetical protein